MSISSTILRRAAASTALVAALTVTTVVSAAEWKDGKLQPLASGFPSERLVILVVDEPGSHDSVYATQLAEAAADLSPVPIAIEHRPDFTSFGNWEGLAWLKDQDLGKEGYIAMSLTYPGSLFDLMVTDMKTEAGVDLADLNPIIGTEQSPYVIIQRADAPWGTTLEDYLKYAKEHPGEIRHAAGGPGSGLHTAMTVWNTHFGITLKDIVGGSGGERALAVAAGEADVTAAIPDVLMPHLQAGKIVPLMVAGKNPAPEAFGNIPNAEEAGIKDDKFAQTRFITMSPDAPDEVRAWWFELLKAASEKESFKNNRTQLPGVTPVLLTPEETKALGQSTYDDVLPFIKEQGLYWGDKKP